MPLPDLLKWNDFCRTNQPKPVAFIYVRTGGVFGNVFVDFGPQHVLMDANGQVAFVAAAPTRVTPLAAPGGSQRAQPSGLRAQAPAALTPAAAALAGAAAALRGRRARRAARLERKAFGKFLGNIKFPWDNDKDDKAESSSGAEKGKPSTTWKELLLLKDLGQSSFDKALQVNLDNSIYGSFAEIGAGQEVSRTFLTAGAAAGTVARSLSAYDMQISDVTYGKAARYVTKERLGQMLQTEYDTLEASIRDEPWLQSTRIVVLRIREP
ncbi:UBA2 [Symbiodinium sp. CCMP2592]|nr:UBA2 [Symbiodinium sp. CCMP2592]